MPDATRSEGALRRAGICLSLANLCFLPTWSNLLDGWHSPYFEKFPSPSRDAGAVMLDVLVVAAIFWIGQSLARRMKVATCVAQVVFVAICIVALNDIRQMVPWLTMPVLRERFGRSAELVGLAVVGSILLLVVRNPRRTVAALVALLLVLLPFAAFTFGWAARRTVQFGAPAALADLPPAPLTSPPQRRLVWLILDEMDEGLTFVDRPAGLALPELDRLRGESLYATNAYPPANHTLLSLPALISGVPVVRASPAAPDRLNVRLAGANTAVDWKTLPNIFSTLRIAGSSSALVGWYHPYCRMFEALSSCSWEPFRAHETSLTLARRMFELSIYALDSVPGARRFQLLERFGGGHDPREAAAAVEQFATLEARAKAAAGDPRFALVFIHLPVPHAPGKYDRTSGRLAPEARAADWYVDNLALADRVVGELRWAMETSGVWDRTALLLSSDHPWRDPHPHPDPRVPFLLRLPAAQGARYDRPFNNTSSAGLIAEYLAGRISNAEDAGAWLDRHAKRNER